MLLLLLLFWLNTFKTYTRKKKQPPYTIVSHTINYPRILMIFFVKAHNFFCVWKSQSGISPWHWTYVLTVPSSKCDKWLFLIFDVFIYPPGTKIDSNDMTVKKWIFFDHCELWWFSSKFSIFHRIFINIGQMLIFIWINSRYPTASSTTKDGPATTSTVRILPITRWPFVPIQTSFYPKCHAISPYLDPVWWHQTTFPKSQ